MFAKQSLLNVFSTDSLHSCIKRNRVDRQSYVFSFSDRILVHRKNQDNAC